MRTMTVGQWVLAGSALALLAACSDGPTEPAPRLDVREAPVSASGSCGGPQQSGAIMSTSWPLPPVTVTATYSGIDFGMQNLLNRTMNFPGGYGAGLAPCLSDDVATYSVDGTVAPIFQPLPVPDGVDPNWWALLSEREQHVIYAKALYLMQTNPQRYTSIGLAINLVFRDRMLSSKVDSRYRAHDFLSAPDQAEMMAGGIYGCMLYKAFASDPDWYLLNDATLMFAIELSTAFAETQFATRPLRGLQFGRNGAIGAAMAHASPNSDCGWLVFHSIPSGRIKVTDPTSTIGGGSPSGPGGPGGDDTPWY